MLIRNNYRRKGFTIVELLIVIVVIAILAVITIVAYNGIQARARVSSGRTAASSLRKKFEAYAAFNNAYPTFNSTAGTITSALNNIADTSLTGTGITLKGSALTSAPSNDSLLDLKLCAAAASLVSGSTIPTGFVIYAWDYTQTPAAAYAAQAGGTTTIASGAVTNTGTYTCTSVS